MALLQIGPLPMAGGAGGGDGEKDEHGRQVFRNPAGDPLVNENPDPVLQNAVIVTSIDRMLGWFRGGLEKSKIAKAFHWARSGSVWPMTFGLACCAIEMMAVGASKYDLDRFGSGPFRATPRQADLMIVAGTVTHKMGPRVKRLYDQMPEPKYVIAMGACTVGGGPYAKFGYHVVKGVDLLIPVDVHVPGCPPRPEALLEGIFKVQQIAWRRENLADAERENVKPKVYRPGDEQEPHFPAAVELPNIMDRRKTPEQLAAEKPAAGAKKAHG